MFTAQVFTLFLNSSAPPQLAIIQGVITSNGKSSEDSVVPLQVEISSLARFTVTFFELDGVTPLDPTTVTIYYEGPDGTPHDQTWPGNVTRNSEGVFYFDIEPEVSGNWYFKGEGSGGVEACTPDILFQVRPSIFLAG